ncbi:rhomboid family intramembrane serine protease [Boudabousia marimammalium]|uniref:Peptidase S54 rhomboid domain-containing protein n=1 Tax=Boudabousia marimammalium TaxID=156892 RepID=A0A1Q5PSP8_9ACTO|nr:rhomboid family intramembrane serine protease [Boudabousia marimammalium]OKL50553.1 hypothetical protein BM477_00875 [Boudabousia marimammalium]
MWVLYLVGPPLEIAVGKMRFLALYLFSILGGSTFVLFWETLPGTQLALTAGASGAIFGLFGALIVLQRQLQQDIRAMVTLVVINFAWGFVQPGISWQGHFGGLLAGVVYAVVVLLLTPRLRAVAKRRKAVSSGLPYSEIRTSVFDQPAVLTTLQVVLTLVLGAGLYLLNLSLIYFVGLPS